MALTIPRIPDSPDGNEIRRALRVLIKSGATFELRSLPSRRSWIGNDLEEGIEQAIKLGAYGNLYYTLNPIKEGHNKAASDADILSRYWLLFDCDPRRSDVDRCATDEEKNGARELGYRVLSFLAELNWPAPVVVDSGNGLQILYRLDLPNTARSTQWIKAILKVVATECDDELAHIDLSVHNPSRIARLPGSWNRKGESTPERPHRTCRLILAPENMEVVDETLIRELIGSKEAERPVESATNGTTKNDAKSTTKSATKAASGLRIPAPHDSAAAWFKRALDLEAGKVALAPAGQRHNALRASARTLFGHVHHGFISETDIIRSLTLIAQRTGLPDDEIAEVIAWAKTDGMANPIAWPERLGAKPNSQQRATEDNGESDFLTICAADVTPEQVVWLWEDRVPEGFITIFAGRTGLGKSFITCDLVSRITTGRDMPCGQKNHSVGSVLIISEDPPSKMLVPRLLELEADLSLVRFMTFKAMAKYQLEDVSLLDRACSEFNAPPRLIMIDPPTNFLGDHDEHKNSEVRHVLMQLVMWIESKPMGCVLISHVNKQVGKGIEALSRVMGSVAWVSTARVAHAFTPDPDDANRRMFIPMKNNLGEVAKGLAYQITKTPTLAKIEWLGQIDMTADEAMAGEKRKPRHVNAANWLIERFRERREWASDELFKAAQQEGISRDAIFEAKRTLDLPRARKHTNPDGSSWWAWWVPENWSRLAGDGPVEQERLRRWLVLCLNVSDASPHEVINYAKDRGFDEASVRKMIAECDLFEEITNEAGEVLWHYQEAW